MVFRYGKREHTLTVLIETRAVLVPEGIEVEFIPIDQATQTLRTALTRPECPETPDEIEDIAMCRALLQSRVELLGPAGALRSTPGTLEG